jgi:hypothetical protein
LSARRHLRLRLEDLVEQQADYTNSRARRARRRQQERGDPPQEDQNGCDPAPGTPPHSQEIDK